MRRTHLFLFGVCAPLLLAGSPALAATVLRKSVTFCKANKGNPGMATAKSPGLNARLRVFARRASLALVGLAFAAVAQTASAAIPASERQVLVNIYTSTNGATWATSTNWNGAPGTECTWYGVTCDNAQLHVTSISLGFNNLTGSIPPLAGLTNLSNFVVDTNQLTGTLPALTGLTNLVDFNVKSSHL